MGSQQNNNEKDLAVLFSILKNDGIYTNLHVIKKLAKLLNGDTIDFFNVFSMYIVQRDFNYNRFELLKLSTSQKKKIDNNKLYRFEYRKNSNLRIIFVLMVDGDEILVVDAFNENGKKTKGKDSYDKAIKNAVLNYELIKEAIYEQKRL